MYFLDHMISTQSEMNKSIFNSRDSQKEKKKYLENMD